MKIASWNVNSVKARLPHLLAFLEDAQPDVLCLQETKCLAQDFPMLEVKGLGYHVEAIGQRAYNGVALLSKRPAEDVVTGLLGNDEDEQPRFIEASFGEVRVASVYLPNGNPVGTDKFTYKLGWMERLIGHTRELLRREIPFVLAGDYNICPTDDDVYDPVAFRDDALCRHGSALAVSCAPLPWADRRLPRFSPRAAPLYFLGLPGRTLAPRRGVAHRPFAAVAACGRQNCRLQHRQEASGEGPLLRSHPDLVRTRGLA